MPTISKGLTQAYILQDFVFNELMALKENVTGKDGKLVFNRDSEGKPIDPASIAQLVKAWESCQERIRIHRGRPMPGSLRPTGYGKPKRKHSNTPTE